MTDSIKIKKPHNIDPFDKNFFGSMSNFFSDIDGIFDDAFKNFGFSSKIWNNKDFQKELDEKGHVYYGYSAKVGSDGKPDIQTWTNLKEPKKYGFIPKITGLDKNFTKRYLSSPPDQNFEIDPYIQIFDNTENKNIHILVELPGIAKTDIKLKKINTLLVLKASSGIRSYYKEIALKEEPEKIKSSYANGVLEIIVTPKPKLEVKDNIGEDIPIN